MGRIPPRRSKTKKIDLNVCSNCNGKGTKPVLTSFHLAKFKIITCSKCKGIGKVK